MANTSIGLCCRKVRERPKATPVPWGKILVLSAVLFVNQFGSNMIFPFLPFMVHDFFPELNRQEIGQKAGYLGSAFFIGNFAGSMTWGWLSDILGRRPVMLLGVCGTIFSELLFGFSQNFGWAVAGRFLWGLLNGNLGVVRTYVSEICDDTNQATGFAVVGTTAGMSRLLGSVAGGFLAQPASKYTALQVPFFCTFPYLLPCLVGGGISILSLIVAYLFLDETLHTKKKGGSQREQEEVSGHSDSSQVSSNSDIEMVKQDGEIEDSDVEMQQLSGASNLIVESDIDSQSDYEVVSAESSDVELLLRVPEHKKHRRRWLTRVRNYAPSKVAVRVKERAYHYQKQCILCVTWCTHCKEECTLQNTRSFVVRKLKAGVAKLKTMITLLHDRKVLLSTVLYGLTSCISITSNELFPLLMVTHHEHGGYRMDSSEIGVVLMVVGLCQPLWQILVFPRITKCFGYRWTFRLAVLVFAATFVLLPFSNQITGPVPGSNDTFSGSGSGSGLQNNTDYCGNDLNSMNASVNENSVKRIPVYIWVAVIGIFVFVVVSRMTSLTSSMVLVSNSTLPATRGTVNGIGQSAAALGRALGPMAGAPLFAWSADNGSGWPLNFHFVFDLLAVLALLIATISLILPKTIEKKRDTVDEH